MSFKKLLDTPQAGVPEGVRADIPQSWRSGVEYQSDKAVITTAAATAPWAAQGVEEATKKILLDAGLDPKAWMIDQNRIQRKEWLGLRSTVDDDGNKIVETVPLYSLKAVFVPRPAPVDVDELAALITNKPPVEVPPVGHSGWVIGIADLQLGKLENDLDDCLTRLFSCVQQSLALIDALGEKTDLIHIAWLGDEGEYHTSQGGRNSWRTTLTTTETSRVIRRVMLRVIDMVLDAGYARVNVSAVPSNHGEVTRHQSFTGDDDFSVDALVAVSDALLLNPDRYGGVVCMVPERDQDYVTCEVGGVMVSMLHGHKIPGYPQAKKVFDFMAGNALAGSDIGRSDLLLTAHGHHLQMAERSQRSWIMAPSMESVSRWWQQKTGDTGAPGTVLVRCSDGRLGIATKINPKEGKK